MAAFTVEITGANRDEFAQELSDQIMAQQGQAQIYAETERAVDPIAVISVVLAGVSAADILWKWWRKRQKSGANVTIRTASGHVVELSNVTQDRITIILEEDE